VNVKAPIGDIAYERASEPGDNRFSALEILLQSCRRGRDGVVRGSDLRIEPGAELRLRIGSEVFFRRVVLRRRAVGSPVHTERECESLDLFGCRVLAGGRESLFEVLQPPRRTIPGLTAKRRGYCQDHYSDKSNSHARFHLVPAGPSSRMMPRLVSSARIRSASLKSRRLRASLRAWI
jgi:hypothetical protein